MVFHDEETDEYFMSLGFHKWVALTLPVDAHTAETGDVFLSLRQGGCIVHKLCTTAKPDSRLKGVPVEAINPAGESATPFEGFTYKQVGPEEALAQHAILRGFVSPGPPLNNVTNNHHVESPVFRFIRLHGRISAHSDSSSVEFWMPGRYNRCTLVGGRSEIFMQAL